MLNSRALRTKPASTITVVAALLIVIAAGLIAARLMNMSTGFRANPVEAFSDFNFYYYAFTVVLHQPHDAALLYDHDALVAFLQTMDARHKGFDILYGYPPQFALFFSWLGLLTLLDAKIAWTLMSIVLCAIGVILVAKTAYRGDERGATLLLVAIALLNRPIVENVFWGQSNELLFFLLAATLFLMERGKRYWAGLFLALAIVLKVTPLAVAGLLLLRREWRTVAATFAWSVAFTLVTAVYLGFRVVWHYFISDMPRLNAQNLSMGGLPGNNSVRGVLQTISGGMGMPASNATLTTVGLLVALAVCLLSAYLVFRRHADRRIDYALACMTMLVASPMLEPVHMMVTLIPLMILFGTAFEQHGQQGSAIAPRMEMLLGTLAVVLLVFSVRFVSYNAAALIVYGLCVARYFPPSAMRRQARARRFS